MTARAATFVTLRWPGADSAQTAQTEQTKQTVQTPLGFNFAIVCWPTAIRKGFTIAKNQNTMAKRRREMEKREKAVMKRERREQRKLEADNEPSEPQGLNDEESLEGEINDPSQAEA